jgi:hypothetical protein
MIEFIQKQIEASERLFEMMRSDHDTRMKEMEHWARTTQSLIEKLHERDMTIDILRKGTSCPKQVRRPPPPTCPLRTPSDGSRSWKSSSKPWPIQIKRLKDENEALRLDLGLKVHGL